MRRRRPSSRRGVAALEFALAAPVLLVLVGAAMDLGEAFSQSVRLGGALRAGAQYAASNAADSAGISGTITSALAGWGNVSVTVDPMTCQCLDPATGAGSGDTSSAVCNQACPGGMARYIGLHATRPYAPTFPLSRYIGFNNGTQVRNDVVARIQ